LLDGDLIFLSDRTTCEINKGPLVLAQSVLRVITLSRAIGHDDFLEFLLLDLDGELLTAAVLLGKLKTIQGISKGLA